jgi:hypothetical protein
MSTKYPGGFITKSPVAPTTSAASGIWTLDQQQQAQKAGTWPSPPIFIEDLFSTYLYTGNGTSQTITNGIDLAGKGGLVWIKNRNQTNFSHRLIDTVRGGANYLESNNTDAQGNYSGNITSFNSTGFSAGDANFVNSASNTFVSWTFAKQPKFFDIVTYTGNGIGPRAIPHNLGSAPGSIIVKKTSAAEAWTVYHRSVGTSQYLILNGTNAAISSSVWGDTTPTSTNFYVSDTQDTNGTGATYIAYLFAHDAGGFPVSGGGSTNGISCGTFTPSAGGGATVTLGYEPQWILVKATGTTGNWTVIDTMRNYSLGGNPSGTNQYLRANTSGAELEAGTGNPTATGFFIDGVVAASQPHIYIAIRRGPMKTPTVGTSVFVPVAQTGGFGTNKIVTTNFPVDLNISADRGSGSNRIFADRLRGGTTNSYNILQGNVTNAESTGSGAGFAFDSNINILDNWWNTGLSIIFYNFRRAPGFFDEVCYTGDGTFDGSYNVTHNLGAVPEFIIAKRRNSTNNWNCYHSGLTSDTYQIRLNLTTGQQNVAVSWGPTSTTFKPQYAGNADNSSNVNTGTYVAYLFATCAGVSKVGSYTGNGSTQTINCGFTGGARFVLIKRIDDNSDWYVYDTARGMTTLTDPYLLLNSSAAEVATLGSVTTVSTGFALDAAVLAAINTSAASYIFLAIA